MDPESTSMKVENLNYNNFRAWKQKIQLLLALRDFDDVIDDNMPNEEHSQFAS